MRGPDRSTTIAVYGGAFDPPHVGHVLVPSAVLSLTEVSRVLVVPVFEHPHGKVLAPFADRLDMARAAFSMYGRSVEVTTLEQSLSQRGVPSWTVHTLDAVATAHPRARVRLIMGSDLLDEVHRWKDSTRILAEYTPIVIGRTGFTAPTAIDALPELPEVSSSQMRAAIAEGQSDISGLPRSVAALIKSRGLYREAPVAASPPSEA